MGLELAAVACESLLTEGLDFFLVVGDLDAKASALQESVLLELLDNALDDSLAQLAGVDGRFFSDTARALGVLASTGARPSCARASPR